LRSSLSWPNLQELARRPSAMTRTMRMNRGDCTLRGWFLCTDLNPPHRQKHGPCHVERSARKPVNPTDRRGWKSPQILRAICLKMTDPAWRWHFLSIALAILCQGCGQKATGHWAVSGQSYAIRPPELKNFLRDRPLAVAPFHPSRRLACATGRCAEVGVFLNYLPGARHGT